VRFEVPQVFAHLRQLTVRYARWDRSQADLVDPRRVIQATIIRWTRPAMPMDGGVIKLTGHVAAAAKARARRPQHPAE
jgi:hypothetical protein